MKHIDDQKLKAIQDWLGTGSVNIFGRPFAGKDTQGAYLAETFGAPLIGSGEILRSSDNEHVKKIIGTGTLAPTDDFLAIVSPFLAQPQFAKQPLILSSIGRWFGEQISIMDSAQTAGHPIKAVVYLDLSEDDARDRWQKARESSDRGQREDDAHGKLDTRFDEFRNKTLPVINYYRDQGLLIEIDGNQPPNQVSEAIIEQLYARTLV